MSEDLAAMEGNVLQEPSAVLRLWFLKTLANPGQMTHTYLPTD